MCINVNLWLLLISYILDSFTKACEGIGKELLKDGSIELDDLDAWKHKRNKIVNIGVPSYAFLDYFLSSIKNGSNDSSCVSVFGDIMSPLKLIMCAFMFSTRESLY